MVSLLLATVVMTNTEARVDLGATVARHGTNALVKASDLVGRQVAVGVVTAKYYGHTSAEGTNVVLVVDQLVSTDEKGRTRVRVFGEEWVWDEKRGQPVLRRRE